MSRLTRTTPARRRPRSGSSLLCLVLALLLPLQAVAAWALQMAGPAHTHHAVQAQPTSWADSWGPAHPVFKHRRLGDAPPGGLPPGFEWAASRAHAAITETHRHAPSDGSAPGHDDGHASARHHHAPGDVSLQAQADPFGAGQGTDSDGTSPGAGGLMAWATPCDGLRWAAAVGEHPRPAGAVCWRDVAPRLLERPPRWG